MTRIRLLLAHEPGRLALAVLLGFGTIASSIGLLTTSAYLISSAALLPPILDLSVAIVGVRLFGISRGAFRYAERLASHDLSLRISASLRGRMATALSRLLPAGLEDTHSGDLLMRIISDADAWQHIVTRVVIPPLISLVVVAVVFLFAWMLLPPAALVLLAALIVAGIPLPWLANRLGHWSERSTLEDRRQLTEAVVEIIDGAAEIVAYGQEERFLDEVDAVEGRLAASALRTAWITGLNDAAMLLIVGLTEIGLLAVAIPAVGDGRLAGVQLAVVAMLGLVSFEAVQDLPRAYQSLGSSLEAIIRVEHVLHTPMPVEEGGSVEAAPPSPDLAVQDLVLRYSSRTDPALRGVTLELPWGTRTALVGDSGAGKTSLAHVLLRFRDPDSGTYLIGGIDSRQIPGEGVRRRIGFVDDRSFLFTGTVRDNLLIGDPAADDAALTEVCRRTGLGEWLYRLPAGLDTWVTETMLSGGERRRLALGRALLADFAVLILDEPTAGLDEATARAVMNDLMVATAGKTVLLITHRDEGIDAMDRKVLLRQGRVVAVNDDHDDG